MSSDADYEAFLKKSQKDYSAGYEAPVTNTGDVSMIQTETNPHPAISALGERFYTSEVDEAFEGISFSWQKESLPTAGMCRTMISPLRVHSYVLYYSCHQK
jgi:hypothetical protein